MRGYKYKNCSICGRLELLHNKIDICSVCRTKKCENCGKTFIVKGKKDGVKRFCSISCAKQNQMTQKSQKQCEICGANIFGNSFKRFCFDCLIKKKKEIDKKYRAKNELVLKEKKRESYYSGKERICKVCGKKFIRASYRNNKFCSRECFFKDSKTSRLGKKNPAYRNGTRVRGKTATAKHLYACKKYRKAFLEKHNYMFCESCGVNENGTMRFETHHLYFASLFPRHKELHNPKNLICLCIQCHNDFHASKKQDDFKRIEKERGLKKLFNNT